MKRHYYISDDLDELETVGKELIDADIPNRNFMFSATTTLLLNTTTSTMLDLY